MSLESDMLSSNDDIKNVISTLLPGYHFSLNEKDGIKYISINFSTWNVLKPILYGKVSEDLNKIGYTIARNKEGIRKIKFSGNTATVELKQKQRKAAPQVQTETKNVVQEQQPTVMDLAYYRYDKALHEAEVRNFNTIEEYEVDRKKPYSAPEIK
ncbi:MAG: hypothetical protein J5965_24250 [Aeriscardovia sp.]|nr:hypothetical protein [Aeriscardovia sp.]